MNSQFSRVAKVSSYPQSGPASRPVPQDILRHWEKCAREGTYVTNHAAAFNRCTSNIQEKMNSHIALLNDTIVKGKAPKEIVDAIRDLKDLSAFHSSVSVALGTALQHLADSLFIQLANFILFRRDSYLEFVKPGLKPNTWNRLRNAPLFISALFPDDVLATAEQDISKHESVPGAQGPGPGTTQHSGKKQSHYRYKPYDKKDSRQAGYSSQSSQSWRQFSSKSRGRGRGRGGGNSSYFSKSFHSQQYKGQLLQNDSSSKRLCRGSRLKRLNSECKLKCCFSCSMCNRAVTKERHKSLSVSQRNKACQACVLCKSLSLCPQRQRCPSCC